MTAADEIAIAKWNEAHPVGTPVNVARDDGSLFPTSTRSPALRLEGHTAVIWVEGLPGCYRLDRVTPRDAERIEIAG